MCARTVKHFVKAACCLLLLAALAQAQVQAQAQAQSLGDLVEQAKARRQQQLQGTVPRPPARAVSAARGAMATPMLWSLTGLEDRYEAILIYQGKAHTVNSHALESQQLGPWTVQAVEPTGVVLALPSARRVAPLVLAPMPVGTSAFGYLAVLPPLGDWDDETQTAAPAPAVRPAPAETPGPAQPPSVQPPNALPSNARNGSQ